MLLKKVTTCGLALVLAAGLMLPSAQVMAAEKPASNKNNISRTTEKKDTKREELKKTVEITKLKWNDDTWANGLEFEELDKYKPDIALYIKKISEVKVNNRKYEDTIPSSPENKEFTYEFSALGFRVKKGAFREGVNSITIKAEGYMTKVIKFAKTQDIYSLLSQEDKDPNAPDNPQLNPEPLKKAIAEARKIEKGDKSAEAWQALKDAIAKAENTLKMPVENQEVYDREVVDLQKAVAAFNNSASETTEVKDPAKQGEYTLTFIANEEGHETSSMIQRVFDRKVKLVVKPDKTMEVKFLNDKNAQSLIDFSVATGKDFPDADKKGFGKKDKEGDYSAYEYTIPISNLGEKRKAAVLVTVMGGQIEDKHNYSKYRKADLIFTSIKEGWNGYQKEIDEQNNITGIERLKQELIGLGLDKNGDKTITKDELGEYKGDTLTLNNCGLTDISMLEGLPATVKTLDLCHNNIKEIPKNLLKGMTGLENFWMENNKIKDIPKGLFQDNKNLKWIAFSNNNVSSLDKGDLDGASGLEELDLEGNMVSKLDKDAFKDTGKLKILSFVGNKMKNIPDGVFKPLSKSLKMLFLYENDFLTLPKAISDLNALEKIMAFDCKIRSIDDVNFSRMKNLKEVILYRNDITHVKKGTFDKNKEMEALDLFDNQLTDFSAKCLPQEVSFRKLDITMNNMKVVDPELKRHQKYNKFYPQKSVMNLKLKKTGNKKVQWTENFTILNLMFWQFHTNDFMVPEISSISEYEEFLKENGWDGDNFLKMLNKKNFDWDIVTELQKKNSKGEFVTVKKIVDSDKDDVMKGSFNVDPKGVYRVVKKMYTAVSGKKQYSFRVMTNELDMSGKTNKKIKLSKVNKLSVKPGHRSAVLKWAKVKNAGGYEISMRKGSSGKYKVIAKNVKKTHYTVKKLKAYKKYGFRVRAIKKTGGKTIYGKYSKTKSLKIRR
ncbi:MAG: leucine-rich repeat protein [Hornefia sp.]|nr:leucine-rich repeat protein [Hornefia sp.]